MLQSGSTSVLATALSIGAFVISLLSLGLSFANRASTERQWRQINRARIRPHGPKLRVYNTMSVEDAKKRNWGHEPVLYTVPGEPSRVQVQSKLQIVDPRTGDRALFGHGVLFTVQEAEAELKPHLSEGPLAIASVIEVVWGFQNDGNLPAADLTLVVERLQLDGSFAPLGSPQRWDELKKGQEIYPQVTIPIPPVEPPTNIGVRVTFEYKSDGQDYREVFTAKWEPVSNNWQLQ